MTAILGYLPGCGAGTAAIVDAASGGSSGGGNASPSISSLVVEDGRVSPARVRFSLRDQESNPAEVSIFYEVPGTASQLITSFQGLAANPITLDTSRDGIEYEFLWTFTDEDQIPDDGSFLEDVSVFATVTGGEQGIEPGANQFGLGVGNDAPVIIEASGPVEEVTGIMLSTFTVKDSSSDIVSVSVEFDIDGDDPDAGWQLARPGLEDSTPKFALENILATKDGSSFVFAWDTDVDLETLERDVFLRFRATDGVDEGLPLETAMLRVDNNEAPAVTILEGSFLAHPDDRNGIPVSYDVFDEEGDPIEVIFQWRRNNESFPKLPTDPPALQAILEDPEERRERRIASEFPTFVEGKIVPVGENSVRLPEVANGPASVLAGRLEGCELQILRASSIPEPVAHTWSSNPLQGPVAVLPVGDGIKALILDVPSPGTWRLREIELATGDVVRDVAAGLDGDPSAMTYEPDEGSVLIATDAGGIWSVSRVDLLGGDVTPLAAFDGTTEAGTVRAIASLSLNTALLTVGSSLVSLDYTDPEVSKALTLLGGLHTPWGLAVDPLNAGRVYLSERDSAPGDLECEQLGACGRLLSFDLNTRAILPLVIRRNGEPGPWFRNPEGLALERSGARLLVVVDAVPGDGAHELMGIDLGGASENEIFPVTGGLPDVLGGIATGSDGLRVLAMQGVDDLAIGGGLEQERTIVAHDPIGRVVSVSDAFRPVPDTSRRWRVPRPSCTPELTRTRRTFVWDSRDVGPGGEADSGDVLLRGIPLDTDRGLAGETSAPKRVARNFGDEILQLGDSKTTDGAFSVAAADLDGDGDQDLVSANQLSDNLTVFFQIAPGVFETTPLVLGNSQTNDGTVSVVTADLDGDGDSDIVSANGAGDNLTIFFQSAAGVFGTAPLVLGDSQTTGGVFSVAAADLDGDGDLDLVSANPDSDTLTVFFQSAAGSFEATPLVLGDSQTTDGVLSVAAADLDGDGDLDLVSANQLSSNLTVFFQSAAGIFESTPLVLGDSQTTGEPVSVAAADLDGDGDLDLVSANQLSGTLTVFFQSAAGIFESTPLVLGDSQTPGAHVSVAAADLDGDGDLDLVSANNTSDTLTVFFQGAAGIFEATPLVLGDSQTTDGPVHVAAADLDGDGDQDIVSANSNIDTLTVFWNKD